MRVFSVISFRMLCRGDRAIYVFITYLQCINQHGVKIASLHIEKWESSHNRGHLEDVQCTRPITALAICGLSIYRTVEIFL